MRLTIFILLFVEILLNLHKTASASKPDTSSPKKGSEKSKDDDVISDKELEEMMKDPKYAQIIKDAGGIEALLSDSPSSSKSNKSLGKQSHTKSAGGPVPSHSLATSSPKQSYKPKPSSAKLTEDLNPDVLKEISTELSTSSPKLASPRQKPKPVIDKFKSFEFINKQEARYLLEILKQPVFYNMLPPQAQHIVKKVTNDNFSFKTFDNEKINNFIETSLINSPNSIAFIDPDGKVGRKGTLTLIDPESGNAKFVWVVSNSKILCFYKSQSFLTIIKLLRNSSLQIKEIPVTPCFLVHSPKEMKDGSIMVCAISTQEKEVWVQTIKSNIINK